MEEFPIIPEKTAMLFFDCLNGSDPEGMAQLKASGHISRLVKIEQACRQAGIAIFYTQPEHRKDGKDWGLVVAGDPPALSYYRGINYKGSHHAEVIPEIAPQPDDYIISKHRWSSFHATCLNLSLRMAGIDTIMLAGGGVSAGILSTAYSARDYDYSLITLSDVTLGRPGVLEPYLEEIALGFSRVMTIDEAIAKFAVPAIV